MSRGEQEICLALGGLRYLPGSWDKRFGNNLKGLARAGKELTDSQREWMYRLLYKYRNQLPRLYGIHRENPYCSQKIKKAPVR